MQAGAAGFTSQEHGIHSVHNEPTRLASRHSFLSTTFPDEESLAAGISFPPNRLLHNQHVLHMDQLLEDPQRFCINESATVQLASMTNRGNCSKLVLLLPVARTWRRVLVFLLSVLLCCSVRQLKPGQLATELTALNLNPSGQKQKQNTHPHPQRKEKHPRRKTARWCLLLALFCRCCGVLLSQHESHTLPLPQQQQTTRTEAHTRSYGKTRKALLP